MDPDICLRELLDLCKSVEDFMNEDVREGGLEYATSFVSVMEDLESILSHVQSLHTWLSGGGFPPKVWMKPVRDLQSYTTQQLEEELVSRRTYRACKCGTPTSKGFHAMTGCNPWPETPPPQPLEARD